ncbi:unnamed protein product [Coffea canephora]|uniref:Uncharacterized protein n=2 Tax=Coffea TaxID=13442 RepID=A0A068UF14_COFCA|nr:unnamed protein product [Coffea canephora]
MLRKNLNVDGGLVGGQSKVRKRGSSSSSSSSLVRNYRLKRAILVGKKAGSSTPVPTWKMSSSSRSPSLKNVKNILMAPKGGGGGGGDRGKELSVSARKLAATLWEINGVVSTAKMKSHVEDRKSEIDQGGDRKDRILKSSKVGSVPFYCSDPSFSPLSEKMDQPNVGSHRRRASIGSQKLLPSDCNLGGFTSLQNASLMEVDQNQLHVHSRTPRGNKVKHRLKDLLGALTTSKDLLKVLNHIWRLEEQPPASLSLLSALKVELERAFIQVNKVIHEQKSSQHEIDFLLHQFEEERATWKMKEKERIRSAVKAIAGELEIEKKLKRQTERLNKKLGRELADTKKALARANKELESEKRAREILEQVCDELARGIGEDRAAVEGLKKESAKVREEVEKEREMLHLADVLREERVQMKLLEAKYEFEEKNAAVDELRTELEAYLKTKVDEEQEASSPNYERIKELQKYLRETLPVSSQYQDQEKNDVEVAYKEKVEEAEDSGDSDLHSIELNMDDNSKSYKWSDVVQDGSKKMAINGKTTGRKSTSEKRQRQSISIERQTPDGIEWEFSPTRHRNSDVLAGGKLFEFPSKAWKKECEDEIERYNMIKDLRDHIVSGTRISSSHEVASPQKKLPSQDPSRVVSEAFAVLQRAV